MGMISHISWIGKIEFIEYLLIVITRYYSTVPNSHTRSLTTARTKSSVYPLPLLDNGFQQCPLLLTSLLAGVSLVRNPCLQISSYSRLSCLVRACSVDSGRTQ
jgi:hypothetical protein